ncbi:MAG: 2-succinyl-5-enolpyruvyl-6-hydroxy-3-cyclohexene-1-carboxylic-acid synthase [Myxococcota bacterium]
MVPADPPRAAVAASFRADPDAVYAYVGRFFASLAEAGVEHVVISPGSRSTPLAIAAELVPGLRTWIELDERAAGFFALGIGRATGRPAALVCTSGTAAANYLPAVVEAHHARVPLLVLTADRPSELRDFGAGQTIEQTGLYGHHPRWAVEVPVPEAGDEALRHASILAARAVARATGRPPGAVHLNWPLREPLAPTPGALAGLRAGAGARADADGSAGVAGRGAVAPTPRFSRALAAADPRDVDELVEVARGVERGVVCVGPMEADAERAAALADFAARAGWPLLADPASSLRGGAWTVGSTILAGGDLLARAGGFAQAMRPELVLRLGDAPVSKAQRLWLEAAAPARVWWLDEGGQWGEPSRRVTRVVEGGATALLRAAAARLPDGLAAERTWAERFREADARGRRALAAAVSEAAGGSGAAGAAGPAAFSGLGVAHALARALPAGARLFASNSMPIRLLDLALPVRREPLAVLCNRGAAGIDGVTSTALGVAAATGRPTVLFTGDLAFLHDLSGLLIARREAIPLTIVVLDDGGGGIFSFLPVAEQGEAVAFDRLFRTPHAVELSRAAALFGLELFPVASIAELEAALAAAIGRSRVALVHVRVEAEANAAQFRSAVARACAAIDAGLGGGS